MSFLLILAIFTHTAALFILVFIVTGWFQNSYFNFEVLLMVKECEKEVSVVMISFQTQGAAD